MSRYEAALRSADPDVESWTDFADIGSTFNGFVLELDEYIRVEDLYIDAAIRFAVDSETELLRVALVGTNPQALAVDQRVARSDLGPVIRGNLRGQLDCVLEGVEHELQIAFGYDLYMYIAANEPCERAVEEVQRAGLVIEPGVPPACWDVQ